MGMGRVPRDDFLVWSPGHPNTTHPVKVGPVALRQDWRAFCAPRGEPGREVCWITRFVPRAAARLSQRDKRHLATR